MKLGKLLGAGKSFFGGGAMKRYHKDKHVYLPKFNSEKNPFAPKSGEAVADQPAEPPKISPAAAALFGVGDMSKKVEMPVAATPRPTRSTTWAEKLNPFRAPKPVAPPMVNAVQVELSLDAVKPIANDLADADIEVVPVKCRTTMPVEAALLPASRETWEFGVVREVKPV